MLLFLLVELPAWIIGILFRQPVGTWVFFGLPILLAVLGFWNRRACQSRAKDGLERCGHPLSQVEENHLFHYATFYFFPMASASLSRFYSSIYLLCMITLMVEGYRWLMDHEPSLWSTVGVVVVGVMASGLQVRYNPLPFAATRVRKDPLSSSRFTKMALEDLAAAERVQTILAQHPEIIGGDTFWKLFMNSRNEDL